MKSTVVASIACLLGPLAYIVTFVPTEPKPPKISPAPNPYEVACVIHANSGQAFLFVNKSSIVNLSTIIRLPGDTSTGKVPQWFYLGVYDTLSCFRASGWPAQDLPNLN